MAANSRRRSSSLRSRWISAAWSRAAIPSNASAASPNSSPRSTVDLAVRSPAATRWAAEEILDRSLVRELATATASTSPKPMPSPSATNTNRRSCSERNIVPADTATAPPPPPPAARAAGGVGGNQHPARGGGGWVAWRPRRRPAPPPSPPAARGRWFSRFESITDAPHRDYPSGVLGIGLDLLANATDVHGHGGRVLPFR